ncbi:MAG: ATP-binding protein [Acidimicrobiaceae bacterium]|nr:ATP-binding protein [Acidimicrobiaceae bacterium]MYB87832.1 ATP-binding protein [Acidimicrobiaceae bacterium]MYH93122.1 ATP-binding protein [Acidimicrobiaceae bacterium]
MTVFYPRHVRGQLLEALQDSPAVVIHGPRQCGKTTLAQTLCAPKHLSRSGWPAAERSAGLDYAYFTFDGDAARNAARADPVGFVADLPERVVLDEVQRVPELFAAIKLAIDRDRRPGRFVLTGSTNVLLVPALADSLAGRMQIVRLHPLSQVELANPGGPAERAGPEPGFLDSVFGDGFPVASSERLGGRLRERIAAGGYPAALTRPAGRRRTRWHVDYLDAVAQRDVRDLARIARLEVLPRLLEAAAANTGRLFNVSRLAAPFQLSLPTIRDYLTMLERLFLLERLEPWHSNRLKRLIKTPKLHLDDTGLACALLGADPEALRADRGLLGQLVETFVYQELRRQAGWHGSPTRFFHYRDKDGAEVDIVIERGAGLVAGIEVKAGATVTSADFRGLRKLASATGERFAAGVVLYDGELSAGFGDRLRAVPIRRLWEPPAGWNHREHRRSVRGPGSPPNP